MKMIKWTNGRLEQASRNKLLIIRISFCSPDGSVAWVMGQAIPERNTKK
jgi:hypothetical protein